VFAATQPVRDREFRDAKLAFAGGCSRECHITWNPGHDVSVLQRNSRVG
jgi:hypothetical protein